MASSLAIRLAADPVRRTLFGAIGAAYTRIVYPAGTDTGMTKPVRMFVLQNLTDQLVMFSLDGVHDHIPLASTAYIILDVASNMTLSQAFYVAERQSFYVKHMGAAPSSGAVYLSVFYGAE